MPESGQPPGEEPIGPSAGGETTVPPPVSATAPEASRLSFAERVARGEGPPPPVAPPPVLPLSEPALTREQPVPRRSLRRWWLRQLVPIGGLALMAVCLSGLLGEFPAARWTMGSGGQRPATSPPAAGGAVSVVIDPGHGGVDSGAIALGLREKELNLDVALRVAQTLEHEGVHVLMTRATDRAVSLEDRVRIANGTPGAIFVSIHFNDAMSSDRGQSYHASGVETYYSEHKEIGLLAGDWMWTSLFGGGRGASGATGQRDALAWSSREGARLADDIQGSLVAATSAADRGTKERALYVTRRVRGPAVLVEGGFISHPTEAKRLGEPAYRQKLAEAIAAGIVEYLRMPGDKPPVGA